LSLVEEELPEEAKHANKAALLISNDGTKFIPIKKEEGEVAQKQKKIRKVTNSPFHNYQKHLNNALKKMMTLP
jgi:hypothetical protein